MIKFCDEIMYYHSVMLRTPNAFQKRKQQLWINNKNLYCFVAIVSDGDVMVPPGNVVVYHSLNMCVWRCQFVPDIYKPM